MITLWWFAIGVVVGVVGWRVFRAFELKRAVRERRFERAALRATGSDAHATLDDLIEAARAAALRVEPVVGGFDVRTQPPSPTEYVVRVRTRDPSHATPEDIELSHQRSYLTVVPVVLALSQALGPLEVELDDFWETVDGSLDQHELIHAHATRVRRRAVESYPGADSNVVAVRCRDRDRDRRRARRRRRRRRFGPRRWRRPRSRPTARSARRARRRRQLVRSSRALRQGRSRR